MGPLSAPVLATDRVTLVPTHPKVPADPARSPSIPSALEGLLAEGFGEWREGPGESPTERTPDDSPPPAPGPNRQRLLRIAHLSDIHVIDDESPARVATLDAPELFEGAFRPHEGWQCRIVNAAVRAMNRIHADDPLDLVLLGGDTLDNAQDNELAWALALLDGSAIPLACDSGEPNDPIPGSDNDPKDPFVPVGLDVPWLWVTGNHDVLQQGTLPITGDRIAQSIGATAAQGTRDYTQPGAPIVRGPVKPDPRRALLRRSDLISRVASDRGRVGPIGHGLGAYALQTSKAFYTYDVPGSPIRILVLDTAAETGGAEGILHASDVEGFVKPELARALADEKWVVLASHHATDALGDGSGQGLGVRQPDALTQEEWLDVVTSAPNVILDLVGHGHTHRIQHVGPAEGGFWEVQTGALADFPHQFRLVEIWDEDNGHLTIRTLTVDYVTEGDAVSPQGRRIGIADYTSGWAGGMGQGAPGDRNVVLWRKKN